MSTVRALAAARGVRHEDVADQIGMARATLYKRLAGSRFTDGELARVAWFFDVSINDLYDGLGGRLRPVPEVTIASRADTTRYLLNDETSELSSGAVILQFPSGNTLSGNRRSARAS